jgi:hypothetical protein
LNSKDWTNTIGAVLTRRSIDVGDIVKVERGTWGLKEWYPNRSFAKKDKEAKGLTETEEKAVTTISESPQEEGEVPTGFGSKFLLRKKLQASGSE